MKKYLKRNKFYFVMCVLLFSTAGIMSVFLASIVQKMVDTSVDKNIIQFYHVMILAVLFIIINFLIYVLRGFFRAKYLKNVADPARKNKAYPTGLLLGLCDQLGSPFSIFFVPCGGLVLDPGRQS